MRDVKFRSWLENKNIWGFEEDEWQPKKPYHPSKIPFNGPDDLPIKSFNLQRMIEMLSKFDLGFKKAQSKFMNECQWGANVGAVRAVVTPRLNLKIQRLHYDLESNPVWIMKKHFAIDDANYAGKEDIVAQEIYDQVKNVNDEQMENPIKDVELNELVSLLNIKMKGFTSSTLLPEHQLKKNSETEYTIYYYLRGGGASGFTGGSSVHNIMEVAINLSQNKNRGLIKAMVTVVTKLSSGSSGGGSWVLMPSDFEEYFMPTQSKKEIVESILTALKMY